MKFARRSFVSAIFAFGALLTVTLPVAAQTAGKDYTVVAPAQPTEDASKVEVVEFFSYGCPHCARVSSTDFFLVCQITGGCRVQARADHLRSRCLGQHRQAVLHTRNHRRPGQTGW